MYIDRLGGNGELRNRDIYTDGYRLWYGDELLKMTGILIIIIIDQKEKRTVSMFALVSIHLFKWLFAQYRFPLYKYCSKNPLYIWSSGEVKQTWTGNSYTFVWRHLICCFSLKLYYGFIKRENAWGISSSNTFWFMWAISWTVANSSSGRGRRCSEKLVILRRRDKLFWRAKFCH